jgi:hypothetical protein
VCRVQIEFLPSLAYIYIQSRCSEGTQTKLNHSDLNHLPTHDNAEMDNVHEPILNALILKIIIKPSIIDKTHLDTSVEAIKGDDYVALQALPLCS